MQSRDDSRKPSPTSRRPRNWTSRQRFVCSARTFTPWQATSAAQKNLIHQSEQDAQRGYICPYEIATAYVSLKNNDKAYEWLRKGIEERADCMAWLGVEPWMEPFRSDPRYQQLVREIGLAPLASSERSQ